MPNTTDVKALENKIFELELRVKQLENSLWCLERMMLLDKINRDQDNIRLSLAARGYY